MGVTSKGGRILGYARVSTEDQNLDMQIEALKKAGVHPNHMFVEKVSAAAKNRPKLKLLLKSLRQDDRVVFWKFDRLARNVMELHTRIEQIKAAGAEYISITEHVDTSTPAGKLMLNMIAAFAQFERDMTIDRTRAGVAAAKARGVQFGQPKKIKDKAVVAKIKKWRKERVPFREIQRRLLADDKIKVSVTTIDKYATGKTKI